MVIGQDQVGPILEELQGRRAPIIKGINESFVLIDYKDSYDIDDFSKVSKIILGRVKIDKLGRNHIITIATADKEIKMSYLIEFF